MATYIVLSRLSPEAVDDPAEVRNLAKTVTEKIKSECPGVKWKDSYATLGRFDIIDVIEADDPRQVAKAAMIVRTYGHCTTETMPATAWEEFLQAF